METVIKGVIFDFCGTLFGDSALHEMAWHECVCEKLDLRITVEELRSKKSGRVNRNILSQIFEGEMSLGEVTRLSAAKETIYRRLIAFSPEFHSLAPGAVDLFEHLARRQTPFTIATSACRENVEFYFDFFKLERWFDYDKTVFDDGTLNPKPAPDFFLRAPEKLDVPINQCMVLEDSCAGVISARSAGALKVVHIKNDTPAKLGDETNLIDGAISNLIEAVYYL